MQKTILFQKKASVLAANGLPLGSLERVVLNPASKVVTNIVVRTGKRFNKKEAKVVPVELVDETTEDQIVLNSKARELESCPPFEERRLLDAKGAAGQKRGTDNIPPVIHGYPDLGPAVVPTPEEKMVTYLEQNIPEGTVAMKEGAKVITADGKPVGNVERLLADSSVDQITHLLISRGIFRKARKLIPITWVMTMGEDYVHLRVKKASVEEMTDAPVAA